jgi:hypothetical protein
MFSYRIVWEDEAKAREVELFVRYGLTDGVVDILEIAATQVTLYDAAAQRPLRVLPVHTATGRRLLAAMYLASRENEPALEDEILAAHTLRDDEIGAIA